VKITELSRHAEGFGKILPHVINDEHQRRSLRISYHIDIQPEQKNCGSLSIFGPTMATNCHIFLKSSQVPQSLSLEDTGVHIEMYIFIKISINITLSHHSRDFYFLFIFPAFKEMHIVNCKSSDNNDMKIIEIFIPISFLSFVPLRKRYECVLLHKR